MKEFKDSSTRICSKRVADSCALIGSVLGKKSDPVPYVFFYPRFDSDKSSDPV